MQRPWDRPLKDNCNNLHCGRRGKARQGFFRCPEIAAARGQSSKQFGILKDTWPTKNSKTPTTPQRDDWWWRWGPYPWSNPFKGCGCHMGAGLTQILVCLQIMKLLCCWPAVDWPSNIARARMTSPAEHTHTHTVEYIYIYIEPNWWLAECHALPFRLNLAKREARTHNCRRNVKIKCQNQQHLIGR